MGLDRFEQIWFHELISSCTRAKASSRSDEKKSDLFDAIEFYLTRKQKHDFNFMTMKSQNWSNKSLPFSGGLEEGPRPPQEKTLLDM